MGLNITFIVMSRNLLLAQSRTWAQRITTFKHNLRILLTTHIPFCVLFSIGLNYYQNPAMALGSIGDLCPIHIHFQAYKEIELGNVSTCYT